MDTTTGKANSSDIVVSEGKAPTLTYKQHRKLNELIALVNSGEISDLAALHSFLSIVAKLPLPQDTSLVTLLKNAVILRKRGYIVEELTYDEYKKLKELYGRASYAEPDDMELHEEGAHRNLYDFIFYTLNFDVEAGRGPVYRRANKLLNFNGPKYESNEFKNGSLVQYGELPGMWRVGVIVGRFHHELHGDVYCVRTPYNAIAGQQYDPIKVEQVRPATSNDLKYCIELTRSDIDHKLSHYLEMVAVADK